jgi:predicted small secreted protein
MEKKKFIIPAVVALVTGITVVVAKIIYKKKNS